MKHLFKINRSLLYITFIATILLLATGCIKKEPPEPVLKISTLATGLLNPIGVEVGKGGWVWVTEGGKGQNDGKVIIITQDGKKYDAIVNLESGLNDAGEPDGPNHLLFADGLLYILARGKLYKADVSNFKPGDVPLKASSLAVENIAAFVLAYNFVHKTNETNPYNLTKGPDGNIYIADAAANAIIRREKTGVLSVLAEVPAIPNPTPVGPPQIDAVPTGIIFDGQNFLVTNLLGFPFLPGKAPINKISMSGAVGVFYNGFTSLVDIAEGGPNGRLVLEHGVFGPMGFATKTGRLIWANGTTSTLLADGLNLPVGLAQADKHTWYVTSLGDGSVLKVTY